MTKNETIKKSLAETRLKRKNQICKVFELKIVENRLNLKQAEALKMLFVEAKWLYNHILSTDDVFNYTISNKVTVKNRNGEFEEREFNYIGSQMKQSIQLNMLRLLR